MVVAGDSMHIAVEGGRADGAARRRIAALAVHDRRIVRQKLIADP